MILIKQRRELEGGFGFAVLREYGEASASSDEADGRCALLC